VTKEEEDEPPLPKARDAGVLRQTLALAIAGDGEPEPTGWLPLAATLPLRCHRARGVGAWEREGGEGGENRETGQVYMNRAADPNFLAR
jgi:hypothetical protein